MRTIVVLGGGFGGAYAAQALEKRLGKRDDVRVVLIDRHNFFVFHPLLVEAGTGNVEPRHAVVSIRAFLRKARFLMAEVTGVDGDRRRVRYRTSSADPEEELPYDHLVIALGSVTRLPGIPGLAQHGLEIKSLRDAVALRDRAIRMLELADVSQDPARRAALLHFVVVGANFSGAEVAGELDAFVKEACREYHNLQPRDCRVTLVELADRILGALEPDLAEYATRKLRQRGVDVRLKTTVEEIRADAVRLSTGETSPAHTVIWCAGIAPNPLLARLPVPKDKLGYIVCDPDLRVRGSQNVWGIGDCAVNPDPDGKGYPATAQHAVRQAEDVARNIERVLDGRATEPHVFKTMGTLAALGCRTGVAKVFGVRMSGFPAWFLWRTVYLFKMPGWSRRFRVAIDWALDLFFPRDYVTLGVHREPPRGDPVDGSERPVVQSRP